MGVKSEKSVKDSTRKIKRFGNLEQKPVDKQIAKMVAEILKRRGLLKQT